MVDSERRQERLFKMQVTDSEIVREMTTTLSLAAIQRSESVRTE